MPGSIGSRNGAGLVAGQLARFVVSGGLATALNAIVYWLLAAWAGVAPLVANLFGYGAAVISGYVLHSRFSFRGHGRRDNMTRTTGRFFIVSLTSLGLNSLWVWLLTGPLGGPTWWPLAPMLIVTPLVTFTLNRRWVFA